MSRKLESRLDAFLAGDLTKLRVPEQVGVYLAADIGRYESTTLREESNAVDEVNRLVLEQPSVLVCMEADHSSCHRSRLANEVAKRSSLPIRHRGCCDG